MRNNFKDEPVNYSSLWHGWYHKKILVESVKMAKLKGNETVLDVGCGTQKLKQYLPETCKYLGYDIVPEWTCTKTIDGIKADTIFCIDLFEHLTEEELKTILRKLKATNAKTLVMAFPSNNWLNSFMEFVFNMDLEHAFSHLLNGKQVCKIISTEMGLPTNFKRIAFIHWIAKTELQKKG